jgi:hypothetical protein
VFSINKYYRQFSCEDSNLLVHSANVVCVLFGMPLPETIAGRIPKMQVALQYWQHYRVKTFK